MKALAVFAVVLVSFACFAAEGKEVSFKSGDQNVGGVLYAPKNSGAKLPAVLVLHNWMGLTDWAKQQTSKLADEGYVTLALDMYHGKVAANGDEAYKLMSAVSDEQANRDIKAALAYLRSLPNVDPARVGALGWSMGGGNTLRAAIIDPKLKAAVINYGGLTSEPEKLRGINASVLGLFGGKDGIVPLNTIASLEQNMKQAGKKVQIKIYPEAEHSFDNTTGASFRKGDAEDAWKLTAEFLKQNL